MNLAKIKRWFVVNKTIFTFFVIYLLVTLIVIFFHEIWEDEAQAWLTARDCSPIELIDRMKFEGHFLPWYIIIMPFAKLGLPFKTINVISWVISGISAWLILKYLPCRIGKRAVFIFTLPMVYLYPVIARCYCLIPLSMTKIQINTEKLFDLMLFLQNSLKKLGMFGNNAYLGTVKK